MGKTKVKAKVEVEGLPGYWFERLSGLGFKVIPGFVNQFEDIATQDLLTFRRFDF